MLGGLFTSTQPNPTPNLHFGGIHRTYPVSILMRGIDHAEYGCNVSIMAHGRRAKAISADR